MEMETLDLLTLSVAVIALSLNLYLLKQARNLKHRATNNHLGTLRLLDHVNKQRAHKESFKYKQALVERTVLGGTTAVENIHQTISDTAFNVIESLSSTNKIKSHSRKLRDIHDQTASGVYKSVKVVNKQVGVLTDTLLSPTSQTDSQSAQKRPPKIQNISQKRNRKPSSL